MLYIPLVAAANIGDVLHEQLDYLIGHVTSGVCGCDECARYGEVRALLLEMFGEPSHQEKQMKAGA